MLNVQQSNDFGLSYLAPFIMGQAAGFTPDGVARDGATVGYVEEVEGTNRNGEYHIFMYELNELQLMRIQERINNGQLNVALMANNTDGRGLGLTTAPSTIRIVTRPDPEAVEQAPATTVGEYFQMRPVLEGQVAGEPAPEVIDHEEGMARLNAMRAQMAQQQAQLPVATPVAVPVTSTTPAQVAVPVVTAAAPAAEITAPTPTPTLTPTPTPAPIQTVGGHTLGSSTTDAEAPAVLNPLAQMRAEREARAAAAAARLAAQATASAPSAEPIAAPTAAPAATATRATPAPVVQQRTAARGGAVAGTGTRAERLARVARSNM